MNVEPEHARLGLDNFAASAVVLTGGYLAMCAFWFASLERRTGPVADRGGSGRRDAADAGFPLVRAPARGQAGTGR